LSPEIEKQMKHASFPSITGLHNIYATYGVRPDLFPEVQEYKGKVKLHGTNMGVRITENAIYAQGRTEDLNEKDHGHRFYDFVQENEAYFRGVWQGIDIIVYGEWCGPGIQKKTAVQQIPDKVFAIFMVQDGPSDSHHTECIYDPEQIAHILGELPPRLYILPWEGAPLMIRWADRESVSRAADEASAAVLAVEACDPWVKLNFGVEGIGEGLVYYPVGITNRTWIGTHIFKAKGDKHKVVKEHRVVEIDIEKVASIDAFVSKFVTESRLEQGLEAIGGRAEPKLMGNFLAWMGQDIFKESEDERKISDLDWKEITKPLAFVCRSWLLEKSKVI
jgi:hypothetical protein